VHGVTGVGTLIFHPLLPTVTKDASKKVVYAALAGNLAMAGTQRVPAVVTGGSAMQSEELQ
jgi:hypothetical protein